MNTISQSLVDYVREQHTRGVSPQRLRQILLENEWPAATIDAVFEQVGVLQEDFAAGTVSSSSTKGFAREGVTMDRIIEKFIPIAGALFLIVGFGYLIYANAWVHLPMEIRLGLGFFFSVVIIGGSFSFSEKMKDFTDIGIGSGVLLLYGTLMFGSRTTELAEAMIPEVVTLLTAVIFTVMVAYFASRRNSRTILILGMLGAYITPFVIGQNAVWVENVSFNAYLIYFFAVNFAVFLVGREISVRDIVPLNVIGLFLGVSTLWNLSASEGINTVVSSNFFTSELFTGLLFAVLAIFSVWSLLLSTQRFSQKDEGYLSLGYIAPVVWFAFNVGELDALPDAAVGTLYALIAAACFIGWHVLLAIQSRMQHAALYAAGLLAAFLAIVAFFEEFDVYTSILITYTSLVFGFLYALDTTKTERFASYVLISLAGSILSIVHITEAGLRFETLLIVIALVPAMSAYLLAQGSEKSELRQVAGFYSVTAAIIAAMYVAAEFIDYIDLSFLLFYVAPLLLLGYLAYLVKVVPQNMSHDNKSTLLQMTMAWFALGFAPAFFALVVSVYPAPTDIFIFTETNQPTDWTLIKGISATIILFLGLSISRTLQLEQVIKRPSFILVIFGFATLLLTGNYIISALMNDLQVDLTAGGPRALATTLWWAAIAIYMLYVGLRLGKKYHAEKLLGLLLLGITLVKVILYDVSTMEMQNKIIVLMLVGGALLLFSYRVRAQNLLERSVVE